MLRLLPVTLTSLKLPFSTNTVAVQNASFERCDKKISNNVFSFQLFSLKFEIAQWQEATAPASNQGKIGEKKEGVKGAK